MPVPKRPHDSAGQIELDMVHAVLDLLSVAELAGVEDVQEGGIDVRAAVRLDPAEGVGQGAVGHAVRPDRLLVPHPHFGGEGDQMVAGPLTDALDCVEGLGLRGAKAGRDRFAGAAFRYESRQIGLVTLAQYTGTRRAAYPLKADYLDKNERKKERGSFRLSVVLSSEENT